MPPRGGFGASVPDLAPSAPLAAFLGIMPSSRKRARQDASAPPPPTVALSGGQGQHSKMVEMWRSQTLVDFEVRVAGTVYKAHRNVLAAGSDYFSALLAGAGTAMAQSMRCHTSRVFVPAQVAHRDLARRCLRAGRASRRPLKYVYPSCP